MKYRLLFFYLGLSFFFNISTAFGQNEEVNVTFNLIYDSETHFNNTGVSLHNLTDEYHIHYAYGSFENDSRTITTPPGTYNIATRFGKIDAMHNGGTPFYTRHLLKQEIMIQSDTVIDLNAAESNNLVSIKAKDENGDYLYSGVYSPAAGYPSMINFHTSLRYIHSDYGDGLFDTGNPFYYENGPIHYFYMNDLESHTILKFDFIARGMMNNAFYFAHLGVKEGISSYVTMTNNAQDWVKETVHFKPTIYGEGGNVFYGFKSVYMIGNKNVGGNTFYNHLKPNDPMDGRDYFIDNPYNEDGNNLYVFPAFFEKPISMPNTRNYAIFGSAIFKQGDQTFYAGSAYESSYAINQPRSSIIGGLRPILHPRFSFFPSEMGPEKVQGDNVPIFAMAALISGAHLQGPRNLMFPYYMGRFGEIRDSDLKNTEVWMIQNGDTIFAGNFANKSFTNRTIPSSGEIEIIFENINTRIDEDIVGNNMTTLILHRDQSDSEPPSLKHLQLRNAEGKITDLFESPNDGTIRLTAGDFEYIHEGYKRGRVEYKEGNEISLFYSVSGENDWVEMSLTEFPEYFDDYLGDYYEVSLADIPLRGQDTWYDLKVVCVDEANNSQEQTINPAFKIYGDLGTENFSKNNLVAYPNPFSDKLQILLPDDFGKPFNLKVSDVRGRLIYEESYKSFEDFTYDGSALSPGVYFLTLENGTVSKSLKIIKK